MVASTRLFTASSSVMSVRTASALCPVSLISLATSSSRSRVRAASTRSAPSREHRCASVVPSPGPTPLITTTFRLSIPVIADPFSTQHPGRNLALAQHDSIAPLFIGYLVVLEIRQRCRYCVEVDQLDGGPVGISELTGHPLPAELQKAPPMVERLDPVGHSRILLGDDDAYLAVRIRLSLGVVQRRLVVDVVQRDVPQATQLEAEVRGIGDRDGDHQRLIGL